MHQPSFARVEPLEDRLLLAAASQVKTAFLDNRGQAFFTFTVGLDKSTLSRKTASLYKAGADGQFGTADDVRLYTKVGYTRGRLSLRSDALALNERYRVRLNSAVIKDANGKNLDGEFRGMEQLSGNGRGEGNYDVVAEHSSKAKVRFTTVAGYINVGLYNNTPNTKSKFLHTTNEGEYDESIVHRSVRANDPRPNGQPGTQGIDIVQGGGYSLKTAVNQTRRVHNHGQFNNEGTNLNTKGTIAMANAGANTNTTEYFFNVKANTALDLPPGTYTVFGGVLDADSQATLDALSAMETSLNDQYPLSVDGTTNQASLSGHANVPVRSIAAINARQGISPREDLVVVQRIAQLFNYAATPNVQGAAPAAARSAAVTRSAELAAVPAIAPAVAKAFAATKLDTTDALFHDDDTTR
jgi:peptidylprolyl isomerase